MPTEPAYYLNESDRKAISEMLAKSKGRSVNTPRGAPGDDTEYAPEVYVVLTPSGGIPAMGAARPGTGSTGDDPGSAECRVYQLISTGLIYCGFSVLVYNLSDTAVRGNDWYVATRDKFGTWYVPPGISSSGGGGSGSLTVTTVDGSPSYTGITTLRLDEADGFVLTNPSAGIARIDIADASTSQTGVVNTTTQTFGGDKTFNDDVFVNGALDVDLATTLNNTLDVDGAVTCHASVTVDYDIVGGYQNVGNLSGQSPFTGFDYVGRAFEVRWALNTDYSQRETNFYGADYTDIGAPGNPVIMQVSDANATAGYVNVAGGVRSLGYTVHAAIYDGSNLTTALKSVQFVWSSSTVFRIAVSGTSNAGTYDTATGIWKFSGTSLEADTKFRCNGSDGITVTTAGATFTGGILTAGTITATVNSGSATNVTGIFCGDGATIAGRTLTAPAAGFTITNPTGAAGNPTFVLADDLAALEGMSGTGLVVRTAANTYAQRTLTGPAAGITVSNGDGVSGNPTLALANDLSALEGLGSTGIACRTAADTWAQRTIVSADSSVTITNPGGVAGNIDLSVATGGKVCGLILSVSSTDPTAFASTSTLYAVPRVSGDVSLYTGSAWVTRTTNSALSLALSGMTSGKNYDIFCYDSGGTPTLELGSAWTDDTTRATALTTQNGVLVKSGDATRRYLGTIRATSSTQTRMYAGGDTNAAQLFVWNFYNRLRRECYVWDSTNSWTYSTETWRQADATTANKIEYVCGVSSDCVRASVIGYFANSDASQRICAVGVGVDSTSSNSSQIRAGVSSGAGVNNGHCVAEYVGNPGIGYHYLAWLEIAAPVGTTTWYGDNNITTGRLQSGLVAEVWA